MVKPMNYQGELTGLHDTLLYGWAWHVEHVEERVIVEIYADDYPIAMARAEVWLPDLNSRTIGDGCYGFFVTVNAKTLAFTQRFRARIANTDIWLKGCIESDAFTDGSSPIILGQAFNQRGLRIEGWAWDPANPDHQTTLRFYEGERLLGETVADQMRPELKEKNIGHGKYGFSFTLPISLADGNPHLIRIFDDKSRSLLATPLTVIAFASGFERELAMLSIEPRQRRFLSALTESYQTYAPKSLDFSLYEAWQAQFDRPSGVTSCAIAFLVVIIGNDNLEITLQSLWAQSHESLEVLVTTTQVIDDSRVECLAPAAWEVTLPKRLQSHRGLLAFIHSGDTLEPDALAIMAAQFDDPTVQLAYSDCDYLQHGQVLPWFKPDWDLDLFLAKPLLQHLFCMRAELSTSAYAKADDAWLSTPEHWPWLAVAQVGDDARAIRHVTHVLYHHVGAQCLADEDHRLLNACCQRLNLDVTLTREHEDVAVRRLQWSEPKHWPCVSLIIPTRDEHELLKRCIESLQKTDYPNLELIIVDNDSQQPATRRYFKKLQQQGIRILAYPHRFNYSAINNMAVSRAQGHVIGLINNDVEAIAPYWLKTMVTQLLRPNVGAVGAKLLWPNGMVQHGGVLLGLHGLVGHIGNQWEDDDAGYFDYNQIDRRVSAVTAACLLCYRRDYLELGGLNESAFPVAFNDVDFCLRLRSQGKDIVWAAKAKLWHKESASRGLDDNPAKLARLEKEKNALKQRWGRTLIFDPYYNPNLNLDRYSHNGLSFPPRSPHNKGVATHKPSPDV